MPYKIGVSSGWWKMERPPDLLGLATKVGSFGGTAGVQFIQADLDTTSEFFEPRLEEQMKRIREKMGMELGLHAEIGELMALESAERRLWEQSHLRLIETVKHAAELGMVYLPDHSCTTWKGNIEYWDTCTLLLIFTDSLYTLSARSHQQQRRLPKKISLGLKALFIWMHVNSSMK